MRRCRRFNAQVLVACMCMARVYVLPPNMSTRPCLLADVQLTSEQLPVVLAALVKGATAAGAAAAAMPLSPGSHSSAGGSGGSPSPAVQSPLQLLQSAQPLENAVKGARGLDLRMPSKFEFPGFDGPPQAPAKAAAKPTKQGQGQEGASGRPDTSSGPTPLGGAPATAASSTAGVAPAAVRSNAAPAQREGAAVEPGLLPAAPALGGGQETSGLNQPPALSPHAAASPPAVPAPPLSPSPPMIEPSAVVEDLEEMRPTTTTTTTSAATIGSIAQQPSPAAPALRAAVGEATAADAGQGSAAPSDPGASSSDGAAAPEPVRSKRDASHAGEVQRILGRKVRGGAVQEAIDCTRL